MLHGVRAHHAILQLKSEGLFYLYRGILPPLMQKTFSLSIMFGVYEEVRSAVVSHGCNTYLAKTIGALASGTTEAILMPFERVQTLLADAKYHQQLKNTMHAFKVLRGYGIGEYYRGLVPILLRNGPSNVGFFIIRDEIQCRIVKNENEVLQTATEFICGAMIGVVLSAIFYPFNVLKVSMQCKIGGHFEDPLKVFLRIYKERGGKIRYIYRGVYTNCTRSFLSWGVINTAYEHIKAIIY